MEETTQLDTADDYRTARSIREKRRRQASALLPGVLLLVIGAWALINRLDRPDQVPAAWEVASMMIVGVGLSFLARFLVYGREEAGLLLLGSFITLTAAAIAAAWLVIPEDASLPTMWPVGLIVLGLTFIVTLILAAWRDRRLLVPGLSLIVAGAVALPFTLGLVPAETVDLIATHWPLIFAGVGLAALTIVLRRRPSA
jgi:hypothetical protein